MEPVIALVFAKYPDTGRVKTRLVPPLTPTEAAQLHLASLRAVCENLRTHAALSVAAVNEHTARLAVEAAAMDVIAATVNDNAPWKRLSQLIAALAELASVREAGV